MIHAPGAEPTSHVEAMKNPLWQQAMVDEFQALLHNKTWHLVPSSPDLNIIDCKWVFQIETKTRWLY
jgi:hypothetical protein